MGKTTSASTDVLAMPKCSLRNEVQVQRMTFEQLAIDPGR